MRTALLANGALGSRVATWLAANDDLAVLVLHPPGRRRDTSAAEAAADAVGAPVVSWPDGLEEVRAAAPDLLLSVLFGHLIPAEWLAAPAVRALNLHPGLLPHNAGANPNVWPLVDGSPAGTTLHVMGAAFDDGPVLAQSEVPVHPDDTAASLYERLIEASFALVVEAWPEVGTREPVPQAPGGSYHRVADLASLDPGPDDLALLDRLRARTFPPYGAEFERDGRRYRIRVEIEPLDG